MGDRDTVTHERDLPDRRRTWDDDTASIRCRMMVSWTMARSQRATLEEFLMAELAGRLLADRPRWPSEQPDDLTVWHPATAGEAHMLCQEWSQAANPYREALKGKNLTPHARESMRRQVERILMCFRTLGVAISPAFDNTAVFFAGSSSSPSGADPGAPLTPPPSGPGPGSPP